MCSGRVDLDFVLRSFWDGMDGVFIGGCRLDECNYITHGNYHALNMVLLCKKIMEYLGLNPKRLRAEFMSAGEGNVFAEVMNDFSREVEELGPLGKGEGIDADELKSKLAEVSKLVPYIKLVKKEKMDLPPLNQEEYDTFYTSDEVKELIQEAPSYYIDPNKCQACMRCLRKCPAEAIIGGKNRIHVIDQEKCIKCGTCYEACPPRFGAVQKICGKAVPPPLPEEERTIVRKRKEKNEKS